MKQALITMLELQDAMNSKVHPDWRTQGNAWYRAIWVECAELLDHYGWKWWKAQSPDIEQVELELIDIWHFGISIALEASDVSEPSSGKPLSRVEQYESIALSLEGEMGRAETAVASDPESFRIAVEHFASNTLTNKRFDASGFSVLMQYANLSFDGLFKRYVAKNVLNIFRQDHGYKEGTYRKLWNGQEDNEHLMQVLAALDQKDITRDRLYSELQKRYEDSV